MILEVAVLNVIPEKIAEFEAAFGRAQEMISSIKGFKGLQLQQCLEVENRYILLIKWKKLEDHSIGFRKSEAYNNWIKLLHHFYSPFPIVEHYSMVYEK